MYAYLNPQLPILYSILSYIMMISILLSILKARQLEFTAEIHVCNSKTSYFHLTEGWMADHGI